MTSLVRSGEPQAQDLEGLHARLAELDKALRERAAEVERARSELAAFRIRYRQEVGLLHEELDELERAIDESTRGETADAATGEDTEATEAPPGPMPEPPSRYTSDAARKLFRDVAKAVHPDLARDELARDRRHALMIEANRAYALGDEQRLRWILQAWESSPEAVQGTDPEAARLRLVRRITQIEEQLRAHADHLAALQDSSLWKLKAMEDEAAAQGRDLVRDMVGRLRRDIMVARNRLDAIRWRR
ncbi:MAG: hypothetical protein AB7Q16_00180 [Vicinamibacterales bacterium]